jgi:hypothetical protein
MSVAGDATGQLGHGDAHEALLAWRQTPEPAFERGQDREMR